MYVNKCTKCGAEFETKNPKRVICPNCLYPDKKNASDGGFDSSSDGQQNYSSDENYSSDRQNSYSAGGYPSDSYPKRDERSRYDSQRGYGQGGYQRPRQDGYSARQGGYSRQQQGYDRPRTQRPYDRGEGYNRSNSYNRPQQRPFNRPQQGGFNRSQGGQGRYPQAGGNRRPHGGFNKPQRPPKQLLVNKEQLVLIEELYKKMLPLPNPDAHEVIAEQIGLEARKVFFGINLVRQKMMLPKLAFPKRKLAVSPDQLTAIKMLYEPLLPLPPIGCHKIISAQLKIDEWRVHVGIGLIRKQLGLDRWNPERDDAPEEFKVKPDTKSSEDNVEDKPKKTRGRKKASDVEANTEPANENE